MQAVGQSNEGNTGGGVLGTDASLPADEARPYARLNRLKKPRGGQRGAHEDCDERSACSRRKSRGSGSLLSLTAAMII